jgi:uncharacterized protein YqjF (DUF2071 family)
MKQRWRDLLFLHWRVAAETLRQMLPAPLELDTFEGEAFVGLVPFTMSGVRPVYLPAISGLSDFHETNLRTYVHVGGRDPGVWFFSLDAANSLAVRLARRFFHLPYHRATMAMANGADGLITYRSERRWPAPTPATLALRYGPAGPVARAQPGTLEHFLAERYVLYAHAPDGRLFRGRVHHSPYPLQRGRCEALEENLLAAAGIARPQVAPLAHFARGVEVDVFALERV